MLNTSCWVHSVSTPREQPWWKNILKIHVDYRTADMTGGGHKVTLKSQNAEETAESCRAETGIFHSEM